MTQLIASNQLTLTNVNDGQTPYIHFAYSDNADGTGLTTSDKGQRYIGHYSDYTRTDSTDKTKYTWADRWAKIEVGGKNILRNSSFANAYDGPERFTVGGFTYVNKKIPHYKNLYNSGIPNPTTSYHAMYRESFNGKGPVIEFNESNGERNWKAINAILHPSNLSFGNYTFSADIYATGNGTKIWFGIYYFNKSGVRNFHSGQTTIYITKVNEWHRVSGAIKLNNDIDLTKEVNFYIYAHGFTTNSILYLTKPQLEEGTVPTPYGVSQQDIQADIDSKADQALTQEQLNALNEQRGIYEAELQARATASELEEWVNAYNNYVKANDQNKKEAEASLISTSIRVADVEKVLGAMKERWDFILNYMDVSEDGLFFGKKDGSAEVRVYGDRISMFVAGNEVMYLSKDTINVNNGIFSTSIQIGRFKEEQYKPNPDINIIRYVR